MVCANQKSIPCHCLVSVFSNLLGKNSGNGYSLGVPHDCCFQTNRLLKSKRKILKRPVTVG